MPQRRGLCLRRVGEGVQIGPSLLPGFENDDFLLAPVLGEKRVYLRQLPGGEVQNPLPEFPVKFRFQPRQTLPLFSNAGLGPSQADIQGKIQKKYRAAGCEAQFQRPLVVAVDNPLFLYQDIPRPISNPDFQYPKN